MDCDKDLWSDSTIFRDTLAVYFISSHFKLRQSRKEALALLPRVEAALSVRGPDQLREAIFLSNSLCFNDGDCARSLVRPLSTSSSYGADSRVVQYELMLKRLVNTALARSALEGKHLISPLPNHPTTSVDCVSRSAVFRDWYETRNLASPLDFDTGELEKTRLGKCTCQGACYRARAGIMRGLKLELARIENEYMSVNLP